MTATTLTTKGSRPRVGVVLGCGGIKPMAALSLFEFLAEAGIEIDLMAGCSGGALVATMLGAGYKPAEARQILIDALFHGKMFAQTDRRTILGLASPRLGRFDQTSGIVKPQRLKNFYQRIFKDLRMEDLRPKTVVQATDLEEAQGLILSRGLVREAVYASGAFFPVLPPIRLEGRLLGDGVYSAPVPVTEAVRRNMDVIIAVGFKERSTAPPRGFLEVFGRHIDNTMRSLTHSQMFSAVEMHHYEIIPMDVEFDHAINVKDAHEAQCILETGERVVAEYKERILSAVNNFGAVRYRER